MARADADCRADVQRADEAVCGIRCITDSSSEFNGLGVATIARPNDGPSRSRRQRPLNALSPRRPGPVVQPDVHAERRGWQMTTIETVRRLLVDAPGIAICDSCLTRSCSISLGNVRAITAVLLNSAGFDRHDRCWSCCRNVDAIVYRSKCVHCSRPIESGDQAVIIGADLFHAACRRVLDSREVIRSSGRLKQRSLRLIDESLRRTRPPASE